MFAPNWRMSVIGVNGGMNCCLPSTDRPGLLEHKESHHAVHAYDSSREIQNLYNFGRANSTHKSRSCVSVSRPRATGPCRSRSRSHQRRAAEDPHHRLLCSSDRQATSWSQDQTDKMFQIGVASHNSLGCTIVQHVKRQIIQLCKSISWQKEIVG